MKRQALILIASLFVASMAAQAADSAPQRKPLRPMTQCPDITRINEWHVIDARTLTLRTGPYRYVLKTQHDCPMLGRYGAGLSFRPNNGNIAVAMPRICGDYGDTVASHAQPPCSIESVHKIDKQQFDALNRKAARSGNGADRPTFVKPAGR